MRRASEAEKARLNETFAALCAIPSPFGDEAAVAGVPVPFLTLNTIGPTIMRFGTPEQQAFYLPRIAAGELYLASVTTEPAKGGHLLAAVAALRDTGEIAGNNPGFAKKDRSRFLAAQNRHRDNFGPHVVPAEEYFFLGDNRDNSNDSRVWGEVPRGYLRGRAVLVFGSFEPQETERVESGRGWGRLKERWRVLTGFFSGTRWERTFHIVR